MRYRIFQTAALCVAAFASTAQADVPQRVLDQLAVIDPEFELRSSDTVWVAEAEQICTALTSGFGLSLANPDDPRELRYQVELEAAPRHERPDGYPQCEWYVLTTTASNEDVAIFMRFFDQDAGRVVIPPPPIFANGDLSPVILGLSEDAVITDIGPRFGQLMLLRSQTQAEALQRFSSPIATLQADAAERDADAAERDADAAERDADAAERDADAAERDADAAERDADAAKRDADAAERDADAAERDADAAERDADAAQRATADAKRATADAERQADAAIAILNALLRLRCYSENGDLRQPVDDDCREFHTSQSQ